MARQGDKVTFRSRNDGQIHEGTVTGVADSPEVRAVHGSAVLTVDAPTTWRGWEIVNEQDVASAS